MDLRSYTKQELALLYFPDSSPVVASAHLMRWICRNPDLLKKLHESGYDKNSVNHQYSVPTIYQRVSRTSIFE